MNILLSSPFQLSSYYYYLPPLSRRWPTGGWGSIEYGTTGYTSGQIQGGRWKPLQYFLRRYVYRDYLIAASSDARVLVRSDDAFAPFSGTVTLSLLHVSSGATTPLSSSNITLPPGASSTAWFCANMTSPISQRCPSWSIILPRAGCLVNGSNCILLLSLLDSHGNVVADNFELLAPMGSMTLPAASVNVSVGMLGPTGNVPITLASSATALFVTLTTLAQGRFSDNAFLLPAGQLGVVVDFIPWGPLDYDLLNSTLRVEHVMGYGTD